jgi:formylglycine-generating enzyme required for sulfatase activity
VFEWCFDATAAPGARQPFRGGSWFNCPVCAKCDSRSMGEPTTREPTLGFRVVRTPD